MATQKQEEVLRNSTRRISVRIDIIDKHEKVVDSFEGVATDGSISIDADSVHRRSGSISLIVDESKNLLPSPTSSVWLDKRCGVHIGMENYQDEIIWFNLGRFAMSNIDVDTSDAEKTIRIELKDYMAFLDGTLGGELSHQIRIPRGDSTISYALRTVLSELGRVSVDDIGIDGVEGIVPYDIEKPSGSTVYEIAKELVDLYKGYDFYFNEDGYLVIERIRDHKRSPVIERFNEDERDLTITRSATFDFANIRNSVWVWGDQNDDGTQPSWVYRNRYARQNFSEMSDISDMEIGDVCYLRSSNTSYRWSDFEYVGVAVTDNPIAPISPRSYNWSGVPNVGGVRHEGSYVHIKYSNDGGVTFTGSNGKEPGSWVGTYVDATRRDSDTPADYRWVQVNDAETYGMMRVIKEEFHYVFVRYSSFMNGGRVNGADMRLTPGGADWELLDFNVMEEFNMENLGEKTTVVNKTSIMNEAQARLEAEYELQHRSNFAETISISTVPLYNLNVNQKISVKAEDTGVDEYLVTGLSIPLSLTSDMTISGRKLFRTLEFELDPINRIVIDSVTGATYQWDIGVTNGVVEITLEDKPKGTTELYLDSFIVRDTVTLEEYEWSMGLNDGVPFIRLSDKGKSTETSSAIRDEATGLAYRWSIGMVNKIPTIDLVHIY